MYVNCLKIFTDEQLKVNKVSENLDDFGSRLEVAVNVVEYKVNWEVWRSCKLDEDFAGSRYVSDHSGEQTSFSRKKNYTNVEQMQLENGPNVIE